MIPQPPGKVICKSPVDPSPLLLLPPPFLDPASPGRANTLEAGQEMAAQVLEKSFLEEGGQGTKREFVILGVPDQDAPIVEPAVESAEAKQEDVDNRRKHELLVLVQGHGQDLGLSWFLLLRPLGAMLGAVLAVTAGLVVVTYHDVMVDVAYWWECILFQCSLVYLPMAALFFVTASSVFLNLNSIFTWKNWLITFAIGVANSAFFTVLANVLWVYVLGLRYPVPAIGLVNQNFGMGSQIASIWFQLPADWRKCVSFLRRARWLMAVHLYGVGISAFYCVMWTIFPMVPVDYQPIMAVVLPLCREAHGYFLSRIGKIINLQSSIICIVNSTV